MHKLGIYNIVGRAGASNGHWLFELLYTLGFTSEVSDHSTQAVACS